MNLPADLLETLKKDQKAIDNFKLSLTLTRTCTLVGLTAQKALKQERNVSIK